MAIDPTAPLSPMIPPTPAGTPAGATALAQAIARQALSDATARLGEIVGRATDAAEGEKPVGQAGQASAQDAGHAADTPAKGAPSARTTPSWSAPETRMARVVQAAAAEAAPRQAGLAPLMADVRALVERPDAPAEVRQEGEALLARAPPAVEIATPLGLRRAIARSGVFLEARMARLAVGSPAEAPPRETRAADLKAGLLVFRSALSAWLVRAAPPAISPSSPEPTAQVQAAAETALAARSADASAPMAPDAARQVSAQTAPGPAPATQDLVQVDEDSRAEAPASRDHPPPASVAPSPLAHDVEPARKAASPVAASPVGEPLEPRFAGFTASPRPPAAHASPDRAGLPAVVQLGLIEAEEAARPLSDGVPTAEGETRGARAYGAATAEPRPKAPPPPYAGGPMLGQRPATPDLPADLPLVELVRRLLKGASGALARQALMQIASLPETPRHEGEAPEARSPGARLNLDLPFVTPQGVAVAQMEISRDGGGAGGGVAAPVERTYRARFSIDVEPLGPVHALVTLTGARTRVSLWAERSETIARLRAGEESLGAALREAELSPEVAVHSGAPPSADGGGPLGHFVDQAS
ncbi:flagellar hook-length control protein FliK [uncultured Caulobacter sp.]|nr:flagellar hook-length control protein FliK [uncultured Caulobacter sp.]